MVIRYGINYALIKIIVAYVQPTKPIRRDKGILSLFSSVAVTTIVQRISRNPDNSIVVVNIILPLQSNFFALKYSFSQQCGWLHASLQLLCKLA